MIRKAIPIILQAAVVGTGCTTIAIVNESKSFPRDTAIVLNDEKYLINTIKCAEVRGVSEEGVLDCYAIDGTQSAPVVPANALQVSLTESRSGLEWASPEHQAWLFNYFHGGGQERALANMQAGLAHIRSTLDLIDTIEAAEQMEQDEIKLNMEGFKASLTGGMSARQAHRALMVQWHLNNSRYFTEIMSK
jgi:hypothetical protein